jgi:hypothetical protein
VRGEDLVGAHAVGHHAHERRHRDAQAANARHTAHLPRINGDAGEAHVGQPRGSRASTRAAAEGERDYLRADWLPPADRDAVDQDRDDARRDHGLG